MSEIYKTLFGFNVSKDENNENLDHRRKHHDNNVKLKADFYSTYKNWNDLQWTIEIYMGVFYRMDLLVDTASDWVVVEGADCSTCDGNKYDISASLDDGSAKKVSTEPSERTYGDVYFLGDIYNDNVCLNFSACIAIDFFYITEQRGLKEPIDGILGMARNYPPQHLSEVESVQPGPLFVNELWREGLLEDPVFALYLDKQNEQSWIDFGATDTSILRANESLEPIKMLERDFFWSQYNQAIAIGDTQLENVFRWCPPEDGSHDRREIQNDGSIYSIFDTSSPFLEISSLYYDSFIKEIFAKMPNVGWRYGLNRRVVTECNIDLFPSLFLMFDDKWIEVSPENYIQVDPDDIECMLMIRPMEARFSVYGLPVLMDYYTEWNMKEDTLSFAPHKSSTKSVIVGEGPLPPDLSQTQCFQPVSFCDSKSSMLDPNWY